MSITTQANPASIWLANIIYIDPTSIYAIIFSLILLPLKMYFFIFPAFPATIKWFHQSNFYLHDKIAKSISLQMTQIVFIKFSFYLQYSIQSSIQLLPQHLSFYSIQLQPATRNTCSPSNTF